MSSRAGGVRVLRWSLQCAGPTRQTSGAPAPFSATRRALCSARHDDGSNRRTAAQRVQQQQQPRAELSLQCLTDEGFSEPQARAVHEAARASTRRSDARVLPSLFALGFNPASIVKLVQLCPELFSVKGSQLQQRVGNLRKLGLVEGSLQRVISYYPQILCVPVKRVSRLVGLLRERCQFTGQQVSSILRDSPGLVQDNLGQVEYMFQYVYFRMGCGQADMVKAKLFRVSLAELQCRHGFLERRGLYQTPDKKGQTLVLNPPLKDILAVSEETYLSEIATATREEFDVFRKLLAREQEEEDEQGEEWSSDEEEEEEEDEQGEAWSSDEEEEEEEDEQGEAWSSDEEEEVHIRARDQNTGYNKRKRKH